MLVVLGGVDSSNNMLDSVETYVPEQDVWKMEESLKLETPCSGFSAISFNQSVYMFGGIEKSSSTKNV